MEILAHRGCWQSLKERNTLDAMRLAFENGFGIETDVRDRLGELVISHDMPTADAPTLEEFLRLYANFVHKPLLALNIKSDGLSSALTADLKRFNVDNYFVFDMSVPDMQQYCKIGMNFYCRASEYENDLPFYEQSAGIWLDSFERDWATETNVERYLADGKKVCLVSSELHGRSHDAIWRRFKHVFHRKMALCTDFPFEAEAYFNGKN